MNCRTRLKYVCCSKHGAERSEQAIEMRSRPSGSIRGDDVCRTGRALEMASNRPEALIHTKEKRKMDALTAIKRRKSVRAYSGRSVDETTIRRILDAARFSPSAVNTRPWKLAVVTGAAKKRLEEKMTAAFHDGDRGGMDYAYYPDTFVEPYKSRRRECGLMLYGAVGIKKGDTERRLAQWVANYRAFDAPVMMFLLMQPGMGMSAYIDCGLFLQSVMIAATAEGLATCPQAALGEYPAIVKAELGYPDEDILVCGLAMGYEDPDHPVNSYRTPKFEIDEFVRWYR